MPVREKLKKLHLTPNPSPIGEGKYAAFTLAEVLITLVIIGVIAAITVPSLINKTQNQEYVSKLKKAYSILAQATNLIIAEEGTPKSTTSTSNDGWAYSTENIYNLYKKHLNVAKDCGANTGCLTQKSFQYFGRSGSQNFEDNAAFSKLVLTDGMQFAVTHIDSTCSSSYWGSDNRCANLFIDVNGERKPNKVGIDFFMFVLKRDGLYPAGCDDTGWCNGPTDNTGYGCACKVLRESKVQ